MAASYRAAAQVCVRTPLLSIDELATAAGAGDDALAAQRAVLAALLARPEVGEAIYVASPALYAEIDVWRAAPDSERGRLIERSLTKYVSRMATRSTPFGLCAGVGIGEIAGRGIELTVAEPAAHRRRTRVDNEVLFELAALIAREPAARAALRWRPNTSLTRVAGTMRYAEARVGTAEQRGLRYHLVSVEPTPYLEATLVRAADGARLEDLAAALVQDDEGITADEAAAYVDELASAQILVPELGVGVTGPEPIDAMIDQLAAAGLDDHATRLAGVRALLAAIDDDGVGGDPARYDEVLARLEATFAAAGEARRLARARLVQTDLSIAVQARVGAEVVAEVSRAVELLRRMTPSRTDEALAAFRREFRARWEDREVPLAEALDEESGIGFAAATGPGAEGAPLLAGLAFTGTAGGGSTSWGAREGWLLARLARAWTLGEDEIVLDDAAVRALSAATPAELADAWSVMVRVGHRDDGLAVLVEGGGGPSGARLLGRFCHADARVEAMVRQHLAAEEALRPDVVFAEVVHLAEGRTGNILCRPVLRDHEILYLGRSGAAAERQLPLDDLVVAVRGERVVLRSRRLDREVVPRLTSAHNVARGLGVYRFLAALQAQREAGVGWSWGPFAGAPRLPRVRWGRTVFARAQWTLGADDLAPLARAARSGIAAGFEVMQALRQRLGLPRHVVLVDSDNELWTDLDHALQVDALVDAMAGRTQAVLREVFPAPEDTVGRGPNGARFASELVLAFVRDARAERSAPAARQAASVTIQRQFPPGSRWLYAKLYGGVSTADRVLRDAVAPVVRAAQAGGAIDRWFFVRFADPAPHVRVRFHGEPARLFGDVLPALERACAPLLADGSLWRIQLDTYEREIERYGATTIEACEEVFWHDAEAALTIVEHLDGDAGAEARWQLALRGSDDLLRALGLDAADRAGVFTRGRDALVAEHRASTELLRAIGQRWRRHEPRITELLTRDPAFDAADVLAPGLAALASRDVALRALTARGALAERVDDVAWSLVHMSVNRLLHASQRAQELVMYDFLRRYHARRRALAAARRQEAAA